MEKSFVQIEIGIEPVGKLCRHHREGGVMKLHWNNPTKIRIWVTVHLGF